MPALAYNDKIVTFFNERWRANRLAHAYLLIAPKDSGKFDTALTIAQLVNCQAGEATPCGKCASCIKIAHGNHPDIMIAAQGEETLKVEHVRGILNRAQLRAYEAQMKVFILPDAERMTTEAANAFLKTLEEPAPKTLMLLTTSQPENLLATVKSRCQWVRFSPDGEDKLQQHLVGLGAQAKEADFLAHYANGWLKVGENLLAQGFYARKQEIVATLLVQGISDEHIKEYTDDPVIAREVLAVLVSLIRDAFVLQATGQQGLILNQDQIMQVRDLSHYNPTQLMEIVRQVKQIKVQMDENLNAKMAWQILKERLWNTLSKSS